MSPTPDDLHAFGESADDLEARIAESEARGTPVPPEAHAMLTSLRQLSRALADLQASLGVEPAVDDATPTTDDTHVDPPTQP